MTNYDDDREQHPDQHRTADPDDGPQSDRAGGTTDREGGDSQGHAQAPRYRERHMTASAR